MSKSLAALSLVAIGASAFVLTPAQAKVHCQGAYQMIRGVGLHATPYCEIKNLYKVARGGYGITTSFAKLRSNVSERREVCQAIGHDARVYSTCIPYRNEGGDQNTVR